MIIIPDVHGRTFWKDAVNGRENEQIIFLGDYLDPYPSEGISKEFAIDNFKEIIQFKKDHPDNVTLLLGNHDFMTYIYVSMGACRTDFQNAVEISKIFVENHDLFQIAMYVGKYTFSHAAIKRSWAELYVENNDSPKEIIDHLNNMWKNHDDNLSRILNVISGYRGGYDGVGSIVWADVREMTDIPEYDGWYQIFGHTQLRDHAIVTDHFACIDCRNAYELNNDKLTSIN